jgi:hypothetical protein
MAIQASKPNPRLDQSPKPKAGYPRTPQHEQLEEQLHHPPEGVTSDDDRPTPIPSGDNEGEGSRTAGRHYDEEATEWARDSEKVDKAAEDAEKAIDGAEAAALRKAELKGKRAQHH